MGALRTTLTKSKRPYWLQVLLLGLTLACLGPWTFKTSPLDLLVQLPAGLILGVIMVLWSKGSSTTEREKKREVLQADMKRLYRKSECGDERYKYHHKDFFPYKEVTHEGTLIDKIWKRSALSSLLEIDSRCHLGMPSYTERERLHTLGVQQSTSRQPFRFGCRRIFYWKEKRHRQDCRFSCSSHPILYHPSQRRYQKSNDWSIETP